MPSKHKILYTLNNARMAGTEKHVLLLLDNLNLDLFEPAVAFFSEGPLVEILNNKGIKAWAIPRKRFFDFKAARTLFKIIKNNNFSIVHSHCGQFSCLMAKLAGVKHIIETRHGLYFDFDELDRKSLLRYLINNTKARFVDLTVTVSQLDQDVLINQFNVPAQKVKCIENGIDISEIASLPKNNILDKSLKGNGKIVGTIARFTEQKGLEHFIEAIPVIKEEFPDTKFVIIGDGVLKEKLHALARQLNVYDDILFTGFQENAMSILKFFDIFVLPSTWEGMPYTILEAMALKKPVITTNVFGNKEVVLNGKTGFLVPPRDGAAIAKSVNALLRHPSKISEMGDAGFQRVEQKFSAKEMTKKIEQIYMQRLNSE